MKRMQIYLGSTDNIKDFVNSMNKIEGEVTISCGRYIINAKSIMGIFSLDLTKSLILEIEEWKDQYETLLKKYMV